jgi:hypothetical protein
VERIRFSSVMAHELIISMKDDDGDEKHINTSNTTSS